VHCCINICSVVSWRFANHRWHNSRIVWQIVISEYRSSGEILIASRLLAPPLPPHHPSFSLFLSDITLPSRFYGAGWSVRSGATRLTDIVRSRDVVASVGGRRHQIWRSGTDRAPAWWTGRVSVARASTVVAIIVIRGRFDVSRDTEPAISG